MATSYSTGTVSIGAGSTTLTGVSTAWLTAGGTVDSNGFLKSASPIMRLGGLADPEHGFTLAGAGAVNAEAAAVNATHEATGRYHIHGSLGLAQAGWQIEIPATITATVSCMSRPN